MKILYIANERSDAQVAATALCSIAPDVSVSWASHFDSAADWIHKNRDLAALVVEAQVASQSCTSFLKHLRRLGLTAPAVVIGSEQAGPPLESLKAGADDYIARNHSLVCDLPDVVKRAIERAQAPADAAMRRPLRLLYMGDAALARECVENAPCAIEIAQVLPGPNGKFQPIPTEPPAAGLPLPFDFLLVEHDHPGVDVFAILKEIARRRLRIPVVVVVEWDQELAVPALKLGAVDYVVKAKDPFRALFFRLGRGHIKCEPASTPRGSKDGGDHLQADAVAECAKRGRLERELREALTSASETQQRLNSGSERLRDSERRCQDTIEQERASRKMLEQRLEAAEAALQDAERRHASDMTTSAARVAQQRAQLDTSMAEAPGARGALTQKLAEAQGALERAERVRASDAAATADLLAKRDQAFTISLAEVTSSRDALERQLNDAALALERAHQDRASDAAAAVDRLARSQAELDVRLADADRTRTTLELRLGDVEASFHQREERWAVERLAAAQRQAELEGLIHQERATRANLEHKLAPAEAALHDAEQRHVSAMATAAAQFAERQAQYETRMARAEAAWDMVEEQLSEAAAHVELARQNQASAAADVDRLTHREAELAFLLAEATTARNTLELQLADTESALQVANERTAHERTAAEQAAQRQAEFEARVEQEVEKRRIVEEELAHAETARLDAETRHGSAMTSAAMQLAERQVRFETELAQAAAARDALRQQLSDTEVAVEGARQEHVSAVAAVERLTRREEELVTLLAETTTACNTLELRLADAETAREKADKRAASERLAAAEQAAQREARLEELIHQERATRATLEQNLALAGAALRDAEQQHVSAMTTAATQLAERHVQFNAELTEVLAARDTLGRQACELETALGRAQQDLASNADTVEQLTRREAELVSLLAEATATRNTLERRLADAATALKNADERATRDRLSAAERHADLEARIEHEIAKRETLERARLTAEAKVRQLTAEHTEAQHKLEEVRRDVQQTLDRISSEHATALAKLVASITERDAQLKEQAERHSTFQQAADHARSQLQDGFRTALATRNREIEQLQGKLKAVILELDVTRSDREVLQGEANRVSQLQKQLDESRAEIRRQFEHFPLAMCRCTRDGALTHANRAFAALIGYRKLWSVDFATAAFESADDLRWLIDRCLNTKTIESVESTWRRRDGGRLIVRLSAFASASDVIEIVAEDLTNLRALQDSLGQAQRMEAVGRLASEVAVTCGNLLRDVNRDGQQWLATLGGNTALRHQGEMLLGEVTRAASFLGQLAAYGDEQTNALEPVDLNRVLLDLAPVLKRVAGDHIEIVLPKTSLRPSSALNVDVKAERVKRLLVNVASYGRERMPFGGRLMIELATVVVDRKFIEEHPNVRQGPHVLITVTEVRGTMRRDGPLGLRDEPREPNARSASEKPGVDLGTLQGLIRECGGHLWMKIEPHGDMMVKIHLPLRFSDAPTRARTPIIRTGRSMGRWFHH